MDELDRYLSSGRIKGVDDPIKWWHDNQGRYPHLSQMARDYQVSTRSILFFFLLILNFTILFFNFSCISFC